MINDKMLEAVWKRPAASGNEPYGNALDVLCSGCRAIEAFYSHWISSCFCVQLFISIR